MESFQETKNIQHLNRTRHTRKGNENEFATNTKV